MGQYVQDVIESVSRRYPWAWDVPVFDWNLSLNPHIPLVLHIEKAEGELDLDLTKTHVTDFRLEAGDIAIDLRLPANAGQTAVHIQAAVAADGCRAGDGASFDRLRMAVDQ